MAVGMGHVAQVPSLCTCVWWLQCLYGCEGNKKDLLLSGEGNRAEFSLHTAAFLALWISRLALVLLGTLSIGDAAAGNWGDFSDSSLWVPSLKCTQCVLGSCTGPCLTT